MSLPGLGTALLATGSAFPVARSAPQITSATNLSGSFVVELPTHVKNDLLLVFVAFEIVSGGATSISASAGWLIVFSSGNNSGSGGRGTGQAVLAKIATNSSQSLTVTNSNANGITTHAYALIGAQSAEGRSSQTINPPSETPSWPISNTMWFASLAGNFNTAAETPPTGFGSEYVTSNGNATLSTCTINSAVATLDPASYTVGSGFQPVTMTVAVQPS